MPNRPINIRAAAAVLMCLLSLTAAGCNDRTVHAGVPATAPVSPDAQRPMNTAPDTTAMPPVETAAPPALEATTEAPPPIPAVRPAPPRKPVEGATTADADAEPSARPAAPQIAPQLSPGDQASYARKTQDDIGVAEGNLIQTKGKQLSAAQQDLVAKIRSFVSQSRDASKGGDWARAQNLAQKARLLSVELLNSL